MGDNMKDWEEECKRKLVTAEEAARLVNSRGYVSFTLGREAYCAGRAIASRKNELGNVKILQPFPGFDFGGLIRSGKTLSSSSYTCRHHLLQKGAFR